MNAFKRITKAVKMIKRLKMVSAETTGGPPLIRKSLTQYPLTRFLAYVRVSGGISVSRGPQYSPLTPVSCNTVFSKSQNARKARTLCT